MTPPLNELGIGLRPDNPNDAVTDPDPSFARHVWAPYAHRETVAATQQMHDGKVRVYRGVTGWEFSCPAHGRFGWARYRFEPALAAAFEHVKQHQLGRGGAV